MIPINSNINKKSSSSLVSNMICYGEALKVIYQSAEQRRLSTQLVPVEQAIGRITSEEILSPEAVPSFDNSAMDGFAIRSSSTQKADSTNPLTFRIAGIVAAGDSPLSQIQVQEAFVKYGEDAVFEIMTGAALPPGFNAIVKIEDVKVILNSSGLSSEIRINHPVLLGQNVRSIGEDYQVGQKMIPAHTSLHAEHLLSLTGLGISMIPVIRKPKVSIISTGKELVPYSTSRLIPGMIRNSTGPYLTLKLITQGADAKFHGEIPDDSEVFIELLQRILAEEQPDLIITTGAVSMGKYDFIPTALKKMGAVFGFHKVGIRPGKPILFAEFPEKDGYRPVFFGMPGNPVSTSVGFRFFVDPYLRIMNGQTPEAPLKAKLTDPGKQKPGGLRCFYKGQLEVLSTGVSARVLEGQASFMVNTLLAANAWVVIPEEGLGPFNHTGQVSQTHGSNHIRQVTQLSPSPIQYEVDVYPLEAGKFFFPDFKKVDPANVRNVDREYKVDPEYKMQTRSDDPSGGCLC